MSGDGLRRGERIRPRNSDRLGRRDGEELVEVRHRHLGHRQLWQRFQLRQRRELGKILNPRKIHKVRERGDIDL